MAQFATAYYGTIEEILSQLNQALGVFALQRPPKRLVLMQLVLTGCRTPLAGGGGLTCLCVWQ